MRFFLFFLLSIFLSFLQTSLINFNFLLAFVFIVTLILPLTQALILAFFSGVFLDFLWGGRLGVTSFFFLFCSFLILFLEERFTLNPFFFFFLTFLLATLFSYLRIGIWDLGQSLILTFLVLPFIFRKRKDEG